MEPEKPDAAGHPSIDQAEVKGLFFDDERKAVQAVVGDFLYWTGKLTDNSLTLSVAVIGANWAAFGSEGVLKSHFAKISVAIVGLNIVLNLLGARFLSQWHLDQINYAEQDVERWKQEYMHSLGTKVSWPFTQKIERLALFLREVKTWCPILALAFFLVGFWLWTPINPTQPTACSCPRASSIVAQERKPADLPSRSALQASQIQKPHSSKSGSSRSGK